MSPEIKCFVSTGQKPRSKLLEWNQLNTYFIVGKNSQGFPKNWWWQSVWTLAWSGADAWLCSLPCYIQTVPVLLCDFWMDRMEVTRIEVLLLNQFSFWLNTHWNCVFECSWLWHVNWLEQVWKRTVTQRLIRKATFPRVGDQGLTWLSEGQINMTLLCGIGTQYCHSEQAKLSWFCLGLF